jgi:hypothetical protein
VINLSSDGEMEVTSNSYFYKCKFSSTRELAEDEIIQVGDYINWARGYWKPIGEGSIFVGLSPDKTPGGIKFRRKMEVKS